MRVRIGDQMAAASETGELVHSLTVSHLTRYQAAVVLRTSMAVVEGSAATIEALAMNKCHDWNPAGAATVSAVVGAVAETPGGSSQSPTAAARYLAAAVAG